MLRQLRVWKSRPIKERERGMEKREGKEVNQKKTNAGEGSAEIVWTAVPQNDRR
jgi:hypothetical protein